MHYSQIVITSLALLASVSAAPSPSPEESSDFVMGDGGWWPRADINKPKQLVYCAAWYTNMKNEDACEKPEAKFDKTNGKATKPTCHNLNGVTPKSSISPGTGLNCTLFARPDCNWGAEKNPARTPGWLMAVRYWGVKMGFTYPGRGNFADADWIDRGFDGDEWKGKLPKSIECTKWRKNKSW